MWVRVSITRVSEFQPNNKVSVRNRWKGIEAMKVWVNKREIRRLWTTPPSHPIQCINTTRLTAWLQSNSMEFLPTVQTKAILGRCMILKRLWVPLDFTMWKRWRKKHWGCKQRPIPNRKYKTPKILTVLESWLLLSMITNRIARLIIRRLAGNREQISRFELTKNDFLRWIRTKSAWLIPRKGMPLSRESKILNH